MVPGILCLQSYVDTLCSEEREDRTSYGGGEDSSYDSDYDAEDSGSHQDVSRTVSDAASHQDVSRTASDTLGAEYEEYVSGTGQQPPSAGYTAKVEFGLKREFVYRSTVEVKGCGESTGEEAQSATTTEGVEESGDAADFLICLGYTEKLVQAALHKLGPNPGQNELLEELIKLGAQVPRLQDVTPEGCDEVLEEQEDEPPSSPPLRPVVIDGSNVAMSHGNKKVFSCRGIKLCVEWFRTRGHKDITVFVPKWRKESSRPDNPITDQEILLELERDRCLVFTPSRLVGGKRMVCYDDRYILRLAADVDGIVVSNDNYRDLASETPEFKKVVEERILMYSFVNDRFMPPDDPLGRSGPTLENFLRKQPRRGDPPPPCPYGKKCTYGNKCKFYHPERGPLPHKTVTERLLEQAQKQLQARGLHSRDSSPGSHLKGGKSLSLPLPSSSLEQDSKQSGALRKTPLARTKSNIPGPSLGLSSPPEGDPAHSCVGKSRSVENMAEGPYYVGVHQMSAPPPGYAQWNKPVTDQPVWPVYSGGLGSHVAATQHLTDSEGGDVAGANLHRKLQRQLTLNPTFDPRLHRMRRYMTQASGQPQTIQQSQCQPTSHRPIARHGSGGGPMPAAWDQHLHQNVTRIASAPDTYRPWPPAPPSKPPGGRHMHRLSSTSDPQLNLCAPALEGPTLLSDPFDPTVWPPIAPPPVWPPNVPPPSHFQNNPDNARRKLYYHLASIFPEEQVQKAMQIYPDETNPQRICAAILAMFPKP
uniref:C3H1-type domain-containing protein n=1 Tax=Timema cristinae TaxID=61476 RepID=A0A7R9CBS3_TIMCR|nr:unnamed protein product [Timema cristinae]